MLEIAAGPHDGAVSYLGRILLVCWSYRICIPAGTRKSPLLVRKPQQATVIGIVRGASLAKAHINQIAERSAIAQAARLADPIGHSPTMNWLVRGAIIGAAVGLAAVAIVGTGGLAAVAVVGGLVAGGAGIGEMLSTMSDVPKEVSGAIVGPGSSNVFTNGRPAARAHLDMTMCSKHPPAPLPIATGSATVFINGQPAARVGDTIACSAVITSGSGTVYIGGAKQQTDQISPEDLVPPIVHAAILVVGLGAAVVLAGPVVAVAGLALGTAGGMAGNWAGGRIFGEGSDGQKWSALGGGLVGGLLGGKGGSMLAGKLIPRPATPLARFTKGGLPGRFATTDRLTENLTAKDDAAGFVWHATANPRAAQGVLNGIDPAYLNPNSRFGAAFYVAEQPGTTIAELSHHGVDPTHGIRFELNPNAMHVLDLTNPKIAGAWNYKGGPITPATQRIGIEAQEQGFNVIRFRSERANDGVNHAVLDNFNQILRPVSIAPVDP